MRVGDPNSAITPAFTGLSAETPGAVVSSGTTERAGGGPDTIPSDNLKILFSSSPNDHGMTGSSSTIDHMNQIEGRNPMSNRHRQQVTSTDDSGSPVTRFSSKPPQHHTHVQQVARGLPVGRSGGSGC